VAEDLVAEDLVAEDLNIAEMYAVGETEDIIETTSITMAVAHDISSPLSLLWHKLLIIIHIDEYYFLYILYERREKK
jgi:hypothetical protein